ATPLIEPLAIAAGAVANAPTALPAAEPAKPFPLAHVTNAFGAPIPVHHESHHESQQEDYLWGV
ncbi:MAG: hypothetical protein WAN03_09055, partial [Candidatus Sulfotelmatobacter sp.]